MRQKQWGFTIVELMIVLAILGVITAFAAPALQESIKNSRMTANTNRLIGDLRFARSEAVRLSTQVRISELPMDGSGNTGNWDGDGYMIWADSPGGDDDDYDDGEELRVVADLDSASNLTFRIAVQDLNNSGSPVSEISFYSDGMTDDDQLVAFTLCDDRTGANGVDKGREIRILATGVVTIVDAQHDC